MRVLLVRHGMALARDEVQAAGVPDGERPLTAEGRRCLTETAAALHTLEPQLGTVLSSPLKRALESAEIFAHAYGRSAELTPLLRPGASAASLEAGLVTFAAVKDPIALVGHEPDLGRLAGRWLCATDTCAVQLGTGALCRVDFPAAAAPASGRLRYLIPAGALRSRLH